MEDARRIKNPWTPALEKRLIDLAGEGRSDTDMANLLDLGLGQVKKRLESLRKREVLPARRSRDPWTAALDGRLVVLIREGHTNAQIADALSLRVTQVIGRIQTLRERGVEIPSRRGHARREGGGPWTSDAQERLVTMMQEGYSDADIAQALSLRVTQVRARVQTLRKRGVDVPRRYTSWTPALDDRLLTLAGEDFSEQTIAEELGLTVHQVAGRLRRLRAERDWGAR